jgi:hypothetical protein
MEPCIGAVHVCVRFRVDMIYGFQVMDLCTCQKAELLFSTERICISTERTLVFYEKIVQHNKWSNIKFIIDIFKKIFKKKVILTI